MESSKRAGVAPLLALELRLMNAPIALLADQLDAALPQMQCRRCGYAGCRPYAEAIACGDAINRCPPGGDATDRDARGADGATARPARSAPMAATDR